MVSSRSRSRNRSVNGQKPNFVNVNRSTGTTRLSRIMMAVSSAPLVVKPHAMSNARNPRTGFSAPRHSYQALATSALQFRHYMRALKTSSIVVVESEGPCAHCKRVQSRHKTVARAHPLPLAANVFDANKCLRPNDSRHLGFVFVRPRARFGGFVDMLPRTDGCCRSFP